MSDAPATVDLVHDIRGSGSPVVLLTGTGYPRHTWPDEMIEALSAHHTLITPDHRGTGDTPGTDGDYTTRLFAADVIALLRRLGLGPAHVIGHSMGGRVGQWVAIDGPDVTKSLVLLASGPGLIDAAKQPDRLPLYAMVDLIENGFHSFIGGTIRRSFFTPEFNASDPERVQWLIDRFWDHRPSTRDYLKHVAARQSHRSVDELHRITQPALVVVGTRDRHVGGTGSHYDQSVYLHEHLANSTFVEIPDCQHGYPWQEPDLTNRAILDFLASVDGA